MPFLLRTLGGVRLETEAGAPIPFPEGKPLALLLHLAVERRPVRRAELAALLWPDTDRARGLQSVRQALWVIRRALGEETVVAGTEVVEVPGGVVETDLDRLARWSGGGDGGAGREDPVSLLRGTFAEGFVVPGAPAWEEWVEFTDRRLRVGHGAALHRASVEAREGGSTERSAELARAAASVDPGNPDHRALLASILLDRMETGAAARVLATARLDLAGAASLSALDDLEERIRSLGRASTREPSLRHPDLVGRGRELSLLQGEWRRAAGGSSRVVALAGPPGSGRTRMAEDFGAWVRVHGGAVVRVASLSGERELRRGYLAQLVSQLVGLPGGRGVSVASDALLRSLVPSLGTGPLVPSAPGPALSDAVRDLVGAVSFETPLLVVLDDLHWADPGSRTLLFRVLRSLRDEPVLFLLLVPDPLPGRGLPPGLREGMGALEREGRGGTIRLANLGLEQTRELVTLLLSGPDPGAADPLVEAVHRASGGNPLFIVEILEHLEGTGILQRDAEGWCLSGPLPQRIPLPRTVGEAVDARVAALEGAGWALARRLAGKGEKQGGKGHAGEEGSGVSPDLADPAQFRSAAGDLVELGLARWEGGRLDLAHDGVREAVLRRLRRGGPVGSGSGRRRWGVPAALAALLLLVLAGAFLRAPAPPRYGGGEVWFLGPDTLLLLEPPRGSSDAWRVRPPPEVPPVRQAFPFLGPGGERSWFLQRSSPQQSPWVSRWTPTGGEVTVHARPRADVNFAGVLADGSMVAVTADDPSTPEYDIGLVVVTEGGARPRTILQAAGRLTSGGWSPDGSRLLALVLGNPDTVVTVTPLGDRREQVALRAVEFLTWCGRDRVLLLARGDAGGLELLGWEPGAAQAKPVTGVRPLGGHVACSPDGSAAILAVAEAGRARYVLLELDAGRIASLPLAPGAAGIPFWTATPAPILRQVRLGGDPSPLALGERRTLRAELTGSDGRPRTDPVSWHALEPEIVSVSPSGLVTGNRPGRGRVVAIAGGWRSDTLSLVVRGDALGEDVLLREDFKTLDPARWMPVGTPHPVPVVLEDGTPALSIPGDGHDRDGARSLQGLPLDRGLTVELSVRLRLTRRDRQSLDLVLLQAGSGAAVDVRPGDARQFVLLRWPSDELERFDERELQLRVGGHSVRFPLPPEVPIDDWIRLGLEIRPDGQVAVRVDGIPVGVHPLHLDAAVGDHWHLQVAGAAVDTELLVRNLVVWRGVSYPQAFDGGLTDRGGVSSHRPRGCLRAPPPSNPCTAPGLPDGAGPPIPRALPI